MKYGNWTLGETEELLNIIGGEEVARAVLRGELTLNDIVRQQTLPLPPPLVGTLVKTLTLRPFEAKSVAEAIKLGKYVGVDGNIIRLFADDEVGLAMEVKVDLVEFDQDWSDKQVAAWAKEEGDKKPIMAKHIYAIGVQHPDEQRKQSIVALGSVRNGYALFLSGGSDYRNLCHGALGLGGGRFCLVGFLRE